MWRSIVAARASLCRQVTRNFCSSQNPKVLSSKTLTVHLENWAFSPRTCIIQQTRLFSQNSTNPSDFGESRPSEFTEGSLISSEKSENGDPQIENFVPRDEIDGLLDSASRGSADYGNSQMDSFTPEDGFHEAYDESSMGIQENGDTQVEDFASPDEEEEEKVYYEIDVEQLENVLSLLQSSVDGSFESSLNEMGLTLHEDFVVKVLETPLVFGDNLIGFIRWAMKNKPKFKPTTRVVDGLVRAVCSDLIRKNAYSLWDLVKEIGERENGLLNAEILNQLITQFSKLGKGKAAFEVFNKFADFGCVPNAETYYFTSEALCRRSFYDWALLVCQKMLDAGSLPDNEKVGKIISWLCKGKMEKDAHLVYIMAKDKSLHPPQSSISFLITSLCNKDETVELALEMLDDFSGDTRKYAIKPYSSVIRGLCRIKNTNKAKDLLLTMIAEGPPPGNAVFNTIINGYSKKGDLGEAMEIMKLMQSRGLKPDVYTYTVIISGYANGGQMEEGCKILSEAKKNHSKLSPVTYHTLIRGYCKLEEFDKALELLGEMKNFGVQPNVDEYNKLIQSLCLKALNWETSEKLLEEMKENGLYLDGITKGLIKAVKELEQEEVGTGEEEVGTGEISATVK